MKINYNATASGEKREIGIEVGCLEIITIAGVFLALSFGVVGACLVLGIDPMVVLELVRTGVSPGLASVG